jgi:hypothetical protein
VHEFDFDGGGDRLLFILQAIARADINEFDAGRVIHAGSFAGVQE